jgi:hypothetical protein
VISTTVAKITTTREATANEELWDLLRLCFEKKDGTLLSLIGAT